MESLQETINLKKTFFKNLNKKAFFEEFLLKLQKTFEIKKKNFEEVP